MTARKKVRWVTAEESHRQTWGNPEWVAAREALDAKLAAMANAIGSREAPLVEALRKAGFDVNSASDLFNRIEPWRKDVPIPPYPAAVPILIEHLARPYPFDLRHGIARALVAPWGRVAFDHLVDEFRRTADPKVAAAEQRHVVDLVMAEAGEFYKRGEVESTMSHRWDGFRFALALAISVHFQKEHVPLIVELIRNEAHGVDPRLQLAEALHKRMRRWKRPDPEILARAESVIKYAKEWHRRMGH